MMTMFHFMERPPPVRQLMEVNAQIEKVEADLAELYVERDRLAWDMEQGDHS